MEEMHILAYFASYALLFKADLTSNTPTGNKRPRADVMLSPQSHISGEEVDLAAPAASRYTAMSCDRQRIEV
jgi:hypothetical protein